MSPETYSVNGISYHFFLRISILKIGFLLFIGTTDQYEASIDETLAPNSYFATIFASDQDSKVSIDTHTSGISFS